MRYRIVNGEYVPMYPEGEPVDPVLIDPYVRDDDLDQQVAPLVADHTSATALELRAALLPFWAAGETVGAGAVRMTALGLTIKRNASGTTRPSYDATEAALWTVTGGGGGGSSSASDLTSGTLAPARIADGTLPLGKLAANVVAAGSAGLKLSSQPAAPSSPTTGDVWVPSTPIGAADLGAETTANKGAANGYAGLDSNGKVPLTQLNSAIGVMRSGQYYWLGVGVGALISTGTGTLRLYPISITRPTTIARLMGEIGAAGDAGSVLRLGIYADDGNNLPGALVVDAGTISGTVTTVQEIVLGTPVVLQPGVYWVGGVIQNVTSQQPTVRIVATPGDVPVPMGTSLPTGAGAVGVAVTSSAITGALPATFTFTAFAGNAPRVGAKVA